jgi:hypothetical protein
MFGTSRVAVVYIYSALAHEKKSDSQGDTENLLTSYI